MQDIISIRSRYLLVNDQEREELFRKSIEYSDGIVYISQYTKEDTETFYQSVLRKDMLSAVVYEAAVENTVSNLKEYKGKLPFEEYFIVLGNSYKHKCIDQTLEVARCSGYDFVFVGTRENGLIAKNIYGYKSGTLSEEHLDLLLRKSKAIIFPSGYEGFGLPIVNAVNYRKKIVVNDNALNREQYDYLDYYQDNIYMFEKWEEIEACLDIIDKDPEVMFGNSVRIRNWDDVAGEIEDFLNKAINRPVDYDNLRRRWRDIKYIESIHRCYVNYSMPNKSIANRIADVMYLRTPRLYAVLINYYNSYIKKREYGHDEFEIADRAGLEMLREFKRIDVDKDVLVETINGKNMSVDLIKMYEGQGFLVGWAKIEHPEMTDVFLMLDEANLYRLKIVERNDVTGSKNDNSYKGVCGGFSVTEMEFKKNYSVRLVFADYKRKEFCIVDTGKSIRRTKVGR